jgi:hypothetical protein
VVSLFEGAASHRCNTHGYRSHAQQERQRKDQKEFGAERHNSLFLFRAEFAIRLPGTPLQSLRGHHIPNNLC